MWKLDHKEDWVPKNSFFRPVMLEKTLESPRDSKKIKPVNPKGNWPSIFIGRTDVKLKLQDFGHLMWRASSLEKTLRLGMIEGRRRRGWQRIRSLTEWTWIWANSRRWWRTEEPGLLQSLELQRIGHVVTEQQSPVTLIFYRLNNQLWFSLTNMFVILWSLRALKLKGDKSTEVNNWLTWRATCSFSVNTEEWSYLI